MTAWRGVLRLDPFWEALNPAQVVALALAEAQAIQGNAITRAWVTEHNGATWVAMTTGSDDEPEH